MRMAFLFIFLSICIYINTLSIHISQPHLFETKDPKNSKILSSAQNEKFKYSYAVAYICTYIFPEVLEVFLDSFWKINY